MGRLLEGKATALTPNQRTGFDRFTRIPSLRNVAKTAPYFHDGSVDTLPEAVKLMGRHQLGLELNESDVARLVDFLETLTGPAPEPLAAQ